MAAIVNESGKKENRELRIHALGTVPAFTAATADLDTIVRIGTGVSDLSRTQSWNVTNEKDITGVTDASVARGEETLDISPYYTRKDSPLALLLQKIDENELEQDDIVYWYYEAKVDDEGETIQAWKKRAHVMPQSFGGPADNTDSIPFNLALSGKKIPVSFDFATMIFTEVTP